MDYFKFKDKYGKQVKCPNTCYDFFFSEFSILKGK